MVVVVVVIVMYMYVHVYSQASYRLEASLFSSGACMAI